MALGLAGYFHKANATRKSIVDTAPDARCLRKYRLIHQQLPNAFRSFRTTVQQTSDLPDEQEPQQGDFRLPTGRGRIAQNLLTNLPWYQDLAIPTDWDRDELERIRKRNVQLNKADGRKRPTSHESILFQGLCYQRSKLMTLIAAHDMWDSDEEKIFVAALWEAIDAFYAQEFDAAQKLGWEWRANEQSWYWNNMSEDLAIERGAPRPPSKRLNNLNDDLRRKLMQAKTRTLLRSTLSDLLAKAGRQKSIRNHPAAIWRLIDHPDHWRKGRDLALLALASHRKREEREAVFTSNTSGGA